VIFGDLWDRISDLKDGQSWPVCFSVSSVLEAEQPNGPYMEPTYKEEPSTLKRV